MPDPNFTIRIDHFIHHSPDPALEARVAALEAAMSRVTGELDQLDVSVNDHIAEIQSFVTTTRAQIADLERRVAEETVTDEEVARLQALRAKLDAIDPTVMATLPPEGEPGGAEPGAEPTPGA